MSNKAKFKMNKQGELEEFSFEEYLTAILDLLEKVAKKLQVDV